MKNRDTDFNIKEQMAVCEKYLSAYLPITPQTMIAIAMQTIGKMPVYGTRVAQKESGEAGWFIHCGDFSEAKDFYQPIHAKHIREYLPLVEAYLALSPGYKFIINDKGYEDVWIEDLK